MCELSKNRCEKEPAKRNRNRPTGTQRVHSITMPASEDEYVTHDKHSRTVDTRNPPLHLGCLVPLPSTRWTHVQTHCLPLWSSHTMLRPLQGRWATAPHVIPHRCYASSGTAWMVKRARTLHPPVGRGRTPRQSTGHAGRPSQRSSYAACLSVPFTTLLVGQLQRPDQAQPLNKVPSDEENEIGLQTCTRSAVYNNRGDHLPLPCQSSHVAATRSIQHTSVDHNVCFALATKAQRQASRLCRTTYMQDLASPLQGTTHPAVTPTRP